MPLGRSRSAPEDAAVQDLILRVRWERATKRQFEPGSPGWIMVDRRERDLIEALRARFGEENMTTPALEWLISGHVAARPMTRTERN